MALRRSKASPNSVSMLGVAVALAATACKKERGPGVDASVAARSLFDPAFSFTCSPEEEVGCAGVFDVRVGRETAPHAGAPISGEDALAVRLASLDAATESIRVQALIFRADEAGLHIADKLKQRKRDGIDVKVIVDAMSNLDWKTQWMYFDLKQHGIDVEGYEALYLEWLTAEKLLKPWRANKRFHDKMWIIDGDDEDKRMAVVGGLNLANEYFRVDSVPLNKWHDQDVVLRGPLVADVVAAFDRNYDFFKGIKGKLPRVLNPDNAWKLANKVQEKIARVKVPFWQREELKSAVSSCAQRSAPTLFAPKAGRFLQSRPRFDETYILQAYLNQIGRAQHSILIANAYFIPSRLVVDALKAAAARGVEVIVITNSPETNDIAQVAVVSRALYKHLLDDSDKGVQIYEWVGPEVGEGTLHAKYALFDGDRAIIGSYNLDPRSERLNSETAVALQDPSLVADMESTFRQSMLPKSRRVAFEEAATYADPDELDAKFKLLFSMRLRDWL